MKKLLASLALGLSLLTTGVAVMAQAPAAAPAATSVAAPAEAKPAEAATAAAPAAAVTTTKAAVAAVAAVLPRSCGLASIEDFLDMLSGASPMPAARGGPSKGPPAAARGPAIVAVAAPPPLEAPGTPVSHSERGVIEHARLLVASFPRRPSLL